MKINYKLDKEEQWIEDHAEGYVHVKGAEKRKFDRALAEMRKKRAITLRVRNYDLEKIKRKAEKEGLPYQTLIGSILHKYAEDRLREVDESEKYGKK